MKKITVFFVLLVCFVLFSAGPRPASNFYWATGVPTNLSEPNDNRKNSGWYAGERPAAQHFNWLFNRLGQWIDHLDIYGTNSSNRVIHISTQSNFEYYFGSNVAGAGGIFLSGGNINVPAGTVIYIHPIVGHVGNSRLSNVNGMGDNGTNTYNGRPAYVQKAGIILAQNVKMVGDNDDEVIIIRNQFEPISNIMSIRLVVGNNNADTSFTVLSNGPSNSSVIDTTATTPNLGQTIVIRDGDFRPTKHLVIATNATNTTIFEITPAATNGVRETVSVANLGIELSGFTLDGRADVHRLGGNQSNTNTHVDVRYVSDAKINCRIINSRSGIATSGGALNINGYLIDSEILKIEKCFSASFAGAILGAYGIKSRAYYCGAQADGGSFRNCDWSDLYTYGSYSAGSQGGGVFDCNFSYIVNERSTAQSTASGRGGGASACSNSMIYNYFTFAGIEGGGTYACTNSYIYNFRTISTLGGGTSRSTGSKIENSYCVGNIGAGSYLDQNCDIMSSGCVASNQGGGAFGITHSKLEAYNCSAVNGGGISGGENNQVQAQGCSAVSNGGGAYQSTNMLAYGIWTNTAVVSGTNIDASASAGWGGAFIFNGIYEVDATAGSFTTADR